MGVPYKNCVVSFHYSASYFVDTCYVVGTKTVRWPAKPKIVVVKTPQKVLRPSPAPIRFPGMVTGYSHLPFSATQFKVLCSYHNNL